MTSYRLMRLCIGGPYFEMFFRFIDQHAELSFEDTIQQCRENGFLYPGSLKRELEKQGAEVMEVLVDVEPLQRKWLDENGFDPYVPFDKNDVFFRQLKTFKPEVVHFQTFLALAPEVRRRIKEECPSVRLVVGHRGFPIEDCTGYEDVDAVFLGYPRFHDRWHAVGVKTFFHLHCFDEALLSSIEERARTMEPVPFSFLGTTGWGFGPHDGRYYDLRRVLETTDLVVFGNEPENKPTIADRMPLNMSMRVRHLAIEILRRLPEKGLRAVHKIGQYSTPMLMRAAEAGMRRKKFGPEPPPVAPNQEDFWYFKEKPLRELYPDRIHPPRFGVDYFAQLAASRVTWNRHLEMDGAGANMRLFEACGVGACQLVDYRDEVIEAYREDEEVVIYRSIDECIEKARWLLDNEEDRQRIAAAGQRRTLTDHTVSRRAGELDKHFRQLLNRQ